jgi:hypothetical protein
MLPWYMDAEIQRTLYIGCQRGCKRSGRLEQLLKLSYAGI